MQRLSELQEAQVIGLQTERAADTSSDLTSTVSTKHSDVEAQEQTPAEHPERASLRGRFTLEISPRVISDAILGLSDGLTVPFALTAGLSAFGNTKLVILGGLAELIAGAISMGLGGYVGAKSEA